MEENFLSSIVRLEEAVKTQGRTIEEIKAVMTEEFKFLRSDRHDVRSLIHKHDLQLSDRACVQHTEEMKTMKEDISVLKRNMWLVIGGALAVSAIIGFMFEMIQIYAK